MRQGRRRNLCVVCKYCLSLLAKCLRARRECKIREETTRARRERGAREKESRDGKKILQVFFVIAGDETDAKRRKTQEVRASRVSARYTVRVVCTH